MSTRNISLPSQYKWLKNEPAPRMLLEALKLYGVKEIVGPKHNPEILGWAKELKIDKIYTADETPWCGLAHAIVATRAGKPLSLKGYDILRALKWATWGVPVKKGDERLGDTLVFSRDGGGHVGIYVGEDPYAFHVLGGNQGNEYNIMRIAKNRLYACRRLYASAMPANCRKILLSTVGELSKNEQ